MASWFEIQFTGQPTEADFQRVAELAAQGCTSGQLINEPATYECGDCGDELNSARRFALTGEEIPPGSVHEDDGTPICHSRKMANARRTRQGRPIVGS